MQAVVWWVRRDLRLTDNQALSAAVRAGEQVIPVFVLDPNLLHSANVSPKRLAFLYGGLRALDVALRSRGSRLIVRRGEPAEELARLMTESGAGAIFAEEDYTPYARRRDRAVASCLPLRLYGGLTVHPPMAVLKPDGRPYTVYTPFSRRWMALPMPTEGSLEPAPARLSTPLGLDSLSIPDESTPPASITPFPAGEAEAQRRLVAFTTGPAPPIYRYAQTRDRLALAGTSELSPYLRFGMISARQAVVAAQDAGRRAPDAESRRGAEAWMGELIWREFYQGIIYHFPLVLQEGFRPALRDISWMNDETDFSAWREGCTGYPIVDAAMRQLAQAGWMHNRARMIVASFLVKDLLVDWRWGEQWFMQNLIDGDLAANNGGWQWAAGTGTDAAPYFRVFNPILQGKKYDPEGVYVRRWIPELAGVPPKYIHEPWRMPADAQRAAGCVIGRDYPIPIVDHAMARARALAVYGRAGKQLS